MRKGLYGAVLVGAVALDLGSKELLVHSGRHLATLGGGRLETLDSSGSGFGVYWHQISPAHIVETVAVLALFAGMPLLFEALVRLGERGLDSRLVGAALALTTGGVVANAVSLALWRGNVPNILSVPSMWRNAFCLADIEITLGAPIVLALALITLVRTRIERRRTRTLAVV